MDAQLLLQAGDARNAQVRKDLGLVVEHSVGHVAFAAVDSMITCGKPGPARVVGFIEMEISMPSKTKVFDYLFSILDLCRLLFFVRATLSTHARKTIENITFKRVHYWITVK